jgi:hypothetical protein
VLTAARALPSSSALRRVLADRLSDYLVRAGISRLDVLPVRRNGEVDRAALPAPERGRLDPKHAVVGPPDAGGGGARDDLGPRGKA